MSHPIVHGMYGYMPPKAASHYFEVELTPVQRDALLLLLDGGHVPAGAVADLAAAVRDARRIDAPLFRERLDWPELEREARRQGVSVIDILWDRAHGREP